MHQRGRTVQARNALGVRAMASRSSMRSAMKTQTGGERVALLLLVALAGLLLLSKPDRAPAPWFDEGWNLSVAANLVKTGAYAQLSLGQPVPPTLVSTGWPGILPLAVSFRLFGVGAWQGRLPGILFTTIGFVLVYWLARRLYNGRVAVATLFVSVLMTGAHIHLHPVVLGRQALGEMPALCYLLAGYLCLILDWQRRPWLVLVSVLLWSLALATKSQTIPFFALSLLAPAVITAVRRQWRWTAALAGALLLSLVGYGLVDALPALLFPGSALPESRVVALVQGLFAQRANTNLDMALVTTLGLHLNAFRSAWSVALPALAGLVYAGWNLVANRRSRLQAPIPVGVTEIALLILAGSWFLWWALLSVGWLRYLFPALFVSGMFTGSLLHDLTGGFSLAFVGRHVARVVRPRQWDRRSFGVLLAAALVIMAVAATVPTLIHAYGRDANTSLPAVVAYINDEAPSGAVVETFESELFFLLQRPYHYPSNEVQFQLNRRTFLGQEVPIDYDPLQADPDYLVVGSMGKMWRLYDPLIEAGSFHLVQHVGPYDVYERVRGG